MTTTPPLSDRVAAMHSRESRETGDVVVAPMTPARAREAVTGLLAEGYDPALMPAALRTLESANEALPSDSPARLTPDELSFVSSEVGRASVLNEIAAGKNDNGEVDAAGAGRMIKNLMAQGLTPNEIRAGLALTGSSLSNAERELILATMTLPQNVA